jgi:hypothetical protein
MSKVYAAGTSSSCYVPPERFKPRRKLVGFAVRDRHEERSLLSPDGPACRQFHFRMATGWGKGALPPDKSAPHPEPQAGSLGSVGGSKTDAHSYHPDDQFSGWQRTARRAPETQRKGALFLTAPADARREEPKPRRLDGRKGELKRCQ